MCSPLKVNRRFRGICRLHLQGRKITQARNQHEAGCNAFRFLAWLILQPRRWRRHVPLKSWLISTDYTALYPKRKNSSQPLLWEPQILQQFTSLYTAKDRDFLLDNGQYALCAYPFQLSNHLTDFQEIWYELYSNGGCHNVVLFYPFSFLNEKSTLTVSVPEFQLLTELSDFHEIFNAHYAVRNHFKRPTC
jgi:hypothetical protein